jgi:nitrite reductase/ring-hydroxylating ferredoxin subunit
MTTWHRCDLTADQVHAVDWVPLMVGGQAIVLVALDDGLAAIEDRCSHAGCAFSSDGWRDGGRVICDCHGSEFDIRSGAVVRPPASRPIATYATRVVDGLVEVAG